jgi:cytochrome bd-type quinol oxidase subunit 1
MFQVFSSLDIFSPNSFIHIIFNNYMKDHLFITGFHSHHIVTLQNHVHFKMSSKHLLMFYSMTISLCAVIKGESVK